jgi:hypothetical protein
MTNRPDQTKRPYSSPQFERYGNVKDLTRASATSSHSDNIANTKLKALGKTH